MSDDNSDIIATTFASLEEVAKVVTMKVARKGGLPSVINAMGTLTIAMRNMLALAVTNHNLHASEAAKSIRGKVDLEDFKAGRVDPETKKAIEEFNPELGITKESILFAALLTVRMSPELDHSNDTVPVEFSPMVVLDAMDDFEKLTGKKPDPFLNPAMIASARKNEGIGRDAFIKFAEAHRNNPNLPNTLN